MIRYTNKKNTFKLISIEKGSLSSTLCIQKDLNIQILTFMRNFIDNIQLELGSDSSVYNYIDKSTKTLNQSNENIRNLEFLITTLENISQDLENDIPEAEIVVKVEDYNNTYLKLIDDIYKNTSCIYGFIYSISLEDLSKFLPAESNSLPKEEDNISDDTVETDSNFTENTLIISDINGKVVLPYCLEKIRETLLNNQDKYSSVEDIIEKDYTIPIKNYKTSSVSRFKEAYKLITKREHGSRLKALSLASELFFNYKLHPAIITACGSLDELDIYLACLDENALEDFRYFNIKYEIAPVLSPNRDVLFGKA